MLGGADFNEVYNLLGGIKAWGQEVAVGDEMLGLELFSEAESFTEVLAMAYALEEGLKGLYEAMIVEVANPDVQKVFGRLAKMEVEHQRRLYNLYETSEPSPVNVETFAQMAEPTAAEGGFSIEDYRRRFAADVSKPDNAISIAMTIEAQAMDLYQRAGDDREPGATRDALLQIAKEEKAHLSYLGELMDDIARDL